MKRVVVLPLVLLTAGCLSPLTRRLDALHQEIVYANGQLEVANVQLEEANVRLHNFEQMMRRLLGPNLNAACPAGQATQLPVVIIQSADPEPIYAD